MDDDDDGVKQRGVGIADVHRRLLYASLFYLLGTHSVGLLRPVDVSNFCRRPSVRS